MKRAHESSAAAGAALSALTAIARRAGGDGVAVGTDVEVAATYLSDRHFRRVLPALVDASEVAAWRGRGKGVRAVYAVLAGLDEAERIAAETAAAGVARRLPGGLRRVEPKPDRVSGYPARHKRTAGPVIDPVNRTAGPLFHLTEGSALEGQQQPPRVGAPPHARGGPDGAAAFEAEGLVEMLLARGVGEAVAVRLVREHPENVRPVVARYDAGDGDTPGFLIAGIGDSYRGPRSRRRAATPSPSAAAVAVAPDPVADRDRERGERAGLELAAAARRYAAVDAAIAGLPAPERDALEADARGRVTAWLPSGISPEGALLDQERRDLYVARHGDPCITNPR